MDELITRDTSVREAIARYPGAEDVFERHGLGGCGGPDGPVEPIGFFAAIHHVDPDELLAALNEYAAQSAARATEDGAPAPSFAARAQPYRFFLATAVVLSLGAGISSGIASAMTGGGWGGLRGEAWLALVQTHGHIQVFGFLLLFLAGVAFHVLPRFKQRQPLPASAVYATYALLGGGVLLRALAQPHAEGWLRGPFVASAFIELGGAMLFAALVLRLLASSREREPLDALAGAGVLLLVGALAMNAYLVTDAASNGSRVVYTPGEEAMLLVVAQGVIVLFVLGVATRVLPFFLGAPPPAVTVLWWAAPVIVAGLAARAAGVWAPDALPLDAVALERAGAVVTASGIVAAVAGVRVFQTAERAAPDPLTPPGFGPAVRIAFAWLVAAVALDLYWQLREVEGGATPMYAAGAIRHAFLLGFATLMIAAMGYRIVPVFSGRGLPWRHVVPVAFGLILAASVLRVLPVAFTVSPTPLDFKLMVAGGVLLFAGIALFGTQIGVAMFASDARAAAPEAQPQSAPATPPSDAAPARAPSAAPATGPISAGMTVAQALAVHPSVLQLLIDRGFGPLVDPKTRARMAPITTLERAASFVGSTPEALVDYLNEALAPTTAPTNGADGASAGPAITLIETPVRKEAVLAALESCYDPEVPVNIIDLGLVYDVMVRGSFIRVTMTMTSPGCPAADMLEADVRRALAGIEGIDTVDVEVVEEPPWTPDRISPAGRARLGMR